jgi:hypothetical protein
MRGRKVPIESGLESGLEGNKAFRPTGDVTHSNFIIQYIK